MFEDIEGIEFVVNDIFIWEENEQQHAERLVWVLERAHHQELKPNKSKCQFIKKQQIAYFGHILIYQGLKSDPKKTLAVKTSHYQQAKKTTNIF